MNGGPQLGHLISSIIQSVELGDGLGPWEVGMACAEEGPAPGSGQAMDHLHNSPLKLKVSLLLFLKVDT